MLLPIPDDIREHSADRRWLERQGEEAMDRYIGMHEKSSQELAGNRFVKVMFWDPDSGMMMAHVPKWWKKRNEQYWKQFQEELAAFHPGFKDAWKNHPWDDLEPLDPPTRDDLDPSGPAPVVTVETRGGGASGK